MTAGVSSVFLSVFQVCTSVSEPVLVGNWEGWTSFVRLGVGVLRTPHLKRDRDDGGSGILPKGTPRVSEEALNPQPKQRGQTGPLRPCVNHPPSATICRGNK
jgi:hypothetical protein